MNGLFLCCCLLAVVGAEAENPTAKVAFGTLIGRTDPQTGVISFKGIPYAQPPVGALRFEKPAAWTAQYAGGTRDAGTYGSQCTSGAQGGAEDCLFLNIFLPPASNGTGTGTGSSGNDDTAAMLFIHGGSFVSGAGSDYDGTALAAQHNVAVITVNYRLGSFGWLQVADGQANRGLQDQRTAIAWVRAQSGAFGIDTGNFMVFGESAGAISVNLHLIAPRSAGLFQRALMESGLATAQSHKFAGERFTNYSALAGCSGGGDKDAVLACLRKKTTAEIIKADTAAAPPGGNIFTSPGWGPTVDLDEFHGDPAALMAGGQVNKDVSFAAGSNSNEGWLFIYPSFLLPLSGDGFRKFVRDFITANDRPYNQTLNDAVLAMYPPKDGTFVDNRPLASALGADISFVCGARASVRNMAAFAGGTTRHYLYHFAKKTDGLSLHAAEIPFVWDTSIVASKAGKALAQAMGQFWANFAKYGNPNGPSHVPVPAGAAAQWPVYGQQSDMDIVFDVPFKGATEAGRRKQFCDFWSEQPVVSPMFF